ncbi:Transposable element Tc3 transposase, partial [Caligus rogercresseyi]
TVTVNSERYVKMLQDFFLLPIEELDRGQIWFQQDGATAHTSRASMNVLREHFPGAPDFKKRRFGMASPFNPTYPLVIFLWGYLKSRVYVSRPTNLADLKANIREEITNIPADTLARVMEVPK